MTSSKNTIKQTPADPVTSYLKTSPPRFIKYGAGIALAITILLAVLSTTIQYTERTIVHGNTTFGKYGSAGMTTSNNRIDILVEEEIPNTIQHYQEEVEIENRSFKNSRPIHGRLKAIKKDASTSILSIELDQEAMNYLFQHNNSNSPVKLTVFLMRKQKLIHKIFAEKL